MIETFSVPPRFGAPPPEVMCDVTLGAALAAAVDGEEDVLPHASSNAAPPSTAAPCVPALKRCRRVIRSMSVAGLSRSVCDRSPGRLSQPRSQRKLRRREARDCPELRQVVGGPMPPTTGTALDVSGWDSPKAGTSV